MNVKLLRKVKRHILAMPARMAMSTWIRRAKPGSKVNIDTSWEGPRRRVVPSCGTIACIAGWACILGDAKISEEPSLDEVMTNAQAVLALPNRRLLFVADWLDVEREKYLAAKSQSGRARVVGKVIDRYIATKGAE